MPVAPPHPQQIKNQEEAAANRKASEAGFPTLGTPFGERAKLVQTGGGDTYQLPPPVHVPTK